MMATDRRLKQQFSYRRAVNNWLLYTSLRSRRCWCNFEEEIVRFFLAYVTYRFPKKWFGPAVRPAISNTYIIYIYIQHTIIHILA